LIETQIAIRAVSAGNRRKYHPERETFIYIFFSLLEEILRYFPLKDAKEKVKMKVHKIIRIYVFTTLFHYFTHRCIAMMCN
jgi:hypothetical protein